MEADVEGADAKRAVTVTVSRALTLLGAWYVFATPLGLVTLLIPPHLVTPAGQVMAQVTPWPLGSPWTIAVSESSWLTSTARNVAVSPTLLGSGGVVLPPPPPQALRKPDPRKIRMRNTAPIKLFVLSFRNMTYSISSARQSSLSADCDRETSRGLV